MESELHKGMLKHDYKNRFEVELFPLCSLNSSLSPISISISLFDQGSPGEIGERGRPGTQVGCFFPCAIEKLAVIKLKLMKSA